MTKKSKRTTLVLLQVGLDVETIIISTYPSFNFGGRNSVGHFGQINALLAAIKGCRITVIRNTIYTLIM